MEDRVVFPLLTGLNTPSYLLAAIQTLLALGVPEENVRLLPMIGHFSVPEVCAQEPAGPVYDPKTGRALVRMVTPSSVRPRLTVSIRSETVMRFWEDARGASRHDERIVGRLAHFFPPVMAGIPGEEPESSHLPEDPLDRMTRHVASAYPELLATLPPPVREDLTLIADEMMALLTEPPGAAGRRSHFAAQALQHVGGHEERAACRAVFADLVGKVSVTDGTELDDMAARSRFLRWHPLLFAPDAQAAGLVQEAAAFSEEQRTEQKTFWRAFQEVVIHETHTGRQEIIRELMEILTTETFLAVAGLDAMHGIAYRHGSLSEICDPSPSVPEGDLLSLTGGSHSRSALLSLMQSWARTPDGFLGVRWPTEEEVVPKGKRAAPSVPGSLGPLTEAQRLELLSLLLWRRETGDARMVFELAAQRLIHPGVEVRWETYRSAPAQIGTLTAQPGQTATLGGASVLFPGLVVSLPFAEDADAEADRAKSVLALIQRLFVPVTCRTETVWQEAVGRLNGGSFLRHEFQRGVRFADAWAALTRSADEDEPAVP